MRSLLKGRPPNKLLPEMTKNSNITIIIIIIIPSCLYQLMNLCPTAHFLSVLIAGMRSFSSASGSLAYRSVQRRTCCCWHLYNNCVERFFERVSWFSMEPFYGPCEQLFRNQIVCVCVPVSQRKSLGLCGVTQRERVWQKSAAPSATSRTRCTKRPG